MNVQLIYIHRIGDTIASRRSDFQIKKPEYTAIAIEEEGQYYYWAKGVSICISYEDYCHIRTNPKLYYFSTALKLHHRIERARQARGPYAV